MYDMDKNHLETDSLIALNPTERQIIKFVYRWNGEDPPVTKIISEKLNIPHSTISSTLQRMQKDSKKSDLFDWKPHTPVALTQSGRNLAEHIEHHHHIMEIFLHKSLDLDENQSHQESELLGLSVSCNLAKTISAHFNLTKSTLGQFCICPDDKEQECVFK